MKIAIVGAAGRMGQMLVRQIARTEGCTPGRRQRRPDSNASAATRARSRASEANGVKIGATPRPPSPPPTP